MTFVNILHSEVLDLQTLSDQHRYLFVIYQGFILLCAQTLVSMLRDSVSDHRSHFPFYSAFCYLFIIIVLSTSRQTKGLHHFVKYMKMALQAYLGSD